MVLLVLDDVGEPGDLRRVGGEGERGQLDGQVVEEVVDELVLPVLAGDLLQLAEAVGLEHRHHGRRHADPALERGDEVLARTGLAE